MCQLNKVIAKSKELNDAIKKLNEETDTLNAIVAEKRKVKEAEILKDLQKYIDIMTMLGIDMIEWGTSGVIPYNEQNRRAGIRIRRHRLGVQIDLGCLSTVMDGFYAFHSVGVVISGCRCEEIMNEFCNNWDSMAKDMEHRFAKVLEAVLEDRKEKAVKARENAISKLAAISR